MSVQVRGIIAARGTAVRSLRQAIVPKRLSRRIQKEDRRFEPAFLFPLLVIVLDSATAFFTPHLQFYRLIGAAPALAAAMFSVAGTLGIGLLALLAGFAIAAANHNLGRAPGIFTLLAIILVTLAAAYASRVRQNREYTLAEVRSVADTAQRVLLRPLPQHLEGIDVEVLYQAAAAQARIGGDFYEAMQTPHGVRLIIGDVRGKGLPAVEVASVILSTFRVLRMTAPDLPSLVGHMETAMSHYTRNNPDEALECFATIVLVEIPAGEPIARVLNCGHPAPLLLHDGEVREVEPSAPSPPINMAALLGDYYQVDTIPFTAGDRLLLYTDGVSETRDRTGAFYPLAQRVRPWARTPPRRLLDHLHQDLLAYCHGSRDDDLAALVAHRVTPADREPTELDRAIPAQRGPAGPSSAPAAGLS
ncbi:PP2C family protein-serine/threonine phosphatase [Streptomyces sp. NPDC002763]|uniref:PP2C family protein-serine/threonine phosphatase n=1 Tax=Streptomyces sp. NPDC002763 TaxID=3154427 RepID=UPI00332C3FEC